MGYSGVLGVPVVSHTILPTYWTFDQLSLLEKASINEELVVLGFYFCVLCSDTNIFFQCDDSVTVLHIGSLEHLFCGNTLYVLNLTSQGICYCVQVK